ncbi:MAG: class I SAM-dependent methyltransferase [Firmicutes bacterium]|nr:class I SAM-dependent methyltransferase [Bacillota bacterium]
MKVLDLGCGPNKISGATGVDLRPGPGVDVVHDLNVYPWPFANDEFDLVNASHVLEHLEDVIRAVEEIHRVTKPGGLVRVLVPHFSSADFFTDPTHRHAFGVRSFDYFVEGTELCHFGYSKVRFKKRKVELGFRSTNPVKEFIRRLINRYPHSYEKHLAFLLPIGSVSFELEVLK